jgi:hypothetical protein
MDMERIMFNIWEFNLILKKFDPVTHNEGRCEKRKKKFETKINELIMIAKDMMKVRT